MTGRARRRCPDGVTACCIDPPESGKGVGNRAWRYPEGGEDCLMGIGRDPRGHTVTAVYVGEAVGEPRAQDDARNLALFPADALPAVLAFDHALVLADYLHFRATGEPAPLRHIGGQGDR